MKTCFAAFIPDGTTWAVLFADLELATQGDTLDSAFLHAQDALRGRMQAMMEDKESLPEALSDASDLAQAKEKIMAWCKAEALDLPGGTLFLPVPCDVAEPGA